MSERSSAVSADADKAMTDIWNEWFSFYERHFRASHVKISMADQQAFYEIAQPILRRLVSSIPAQQTRVPEGYALVPLIPTPRMIEVGCENNPTQWNEGTPDAFAADVANDVYVSMVRASAVTSPEGK